MSTATHECEECFAMVPSAPNSLSVCPSCWVRVNREYPEGDVFWTWDVVPS